MSTSPQISRLLARSLRQKAILNDDQVLADKVFRMRKSLFSAQASMVNDDCERISVLCPRRAGKTVGFAFKMTLVALESSQARVAFVAITRGHAKQIIWDELKRQDAAYDLGCKFHETDLTMTFPNGSVVFLGGAETASDIEKYRGRFFDLVVIDEAASFYPGLLNKFIYDIIEPTLHDRAGQLIVGGTPGVTLSGKFYEMTGPIAFEVHRDARGNGIRCNSRPWRQRDKEDYQGVDFEWSFHRWTTADNEAMPFIWERMCKSRKARGIPDSDPVIQREHFGNWVSDNSSLVYNGFDPARNTWSPAPEDDSPFGLPKNHKWRFVCGVDLGYDDDFDLEVAAYSSTCDQFYHVYGFAESEKTISEMAEKIKEVESMFGGFECLVGDRGGLGKAIFAEMSKTHGIHIEAAEKSDKRDYIEILNSEFRHGHGLVLRDSNLANQLQTVQWDARRKKEDKSFANHATDAFLYLCRKAYHHFSRKPEETFEEGSSEWEAWFEEQEYKSVVEKMKEEETQMFADTLEVHDYWGDFDG